MGESALVIMYTVVEEQYTTTKAVVLDVRGESG